MKVIDEAIKNFDKVKDQVADVDPVTADAIAVSEKKRKELEQSAKDMKAKVTDQGAIVMDNDTKEPKKTKSSDLKKMHLEEGLFESFEDNELEDNDAKDDFYIILNGNRTGYGIDQVEDYTVTVGELINILQDYDENAKILIGNDPQEYGFYTYGEISNSDINEYRIVRNQEESLGESRDYKAEFKPIKHAKGRFLSKPVKWEKDESGEGFNSKIADVVFSGNSVDVVKNGNHIETFKVDSIENIDDIYKKAMRWAEDNLKEGSLGEGITKGERKDRQIKDKVRGVFSECKEWLDFVEGANQNASTDRKLEHIINLAKECEELYKKRFDENLNEKIKDKFDTILDDLLKVKLKTGKFNSKGNPIFKKFEDDEIGSYIGENGEEGIKITTDEPDKIEKVKELAKKYNAPVKELDKKHYKDISKKIGVDDEGKDILSHELGSENIHSIVILTNGKSIEEEVCKNDSVDVDYIWSEVQEMCQGDWEYARTMLDHVLQRIESAENDAPVEEELLTTQQKLQKIGNVDNQLDSKQTAYIKAKNSNFQNKQDVAELEKQLGVNK